MNMESHKSNILAGIRKLNRRDLIIFLIPIIIFSAYLYVFNPGIMTLDSFSQLHQIATNEFTNHHPFFHTFIEMLCLKVYGSPISVAILQMLVFSLIWMVICKYTRDDTTESKLFIIQAVITLLISAIPINAIYAITLWKDILFSYFLLLLCFLVKVMVDRNGKVDLEFVIVLAITMAFVAQLRLNGIYLIAVLLIILAVYLFVKNKSSKMFIVLPLLAIFFILIIASLNVTYDVEDNQKDYVFVKTTHMLADYDKHINIDNADKEKIHKLINESEIDKNYYIYYSDPIYASANEQVFDSDKNGYLGLALKYSMQNPMRCLFYLFKSADIVWDITRDNDWKGEPYYINLEGTNIQKAKGQYFASIKDTPKASFEDATDVNHDTGMYKKLSSFVNKARENMILDTLFNSPALYMYLAIILLVAIHLLTKSKEIYLVYLPNFLNIIVVFTSIPVQDNRYLYANLLVCYMLFMILLGILKGGKGKPQAIATEETEKVESIDPELLYESPEEEIPPQSEENQEEMEAKIRARIMKELENEGKLNKK